MSANKRKRIVDALEPHLSRLHTLGYVLSPSEFHEHHRATDAILAGGGPTAWDSMLLPPMRQKFLAALEGLTVEDLADWYARVPDFAPFMITPYVLGLLGEDAIRGGAAAMENLGRHEYAVVMAAAQYLAAGEREFQVTPGLGEALALTDLGDATVADLRFPFACIRILPPPGLFQLQDYDLDNHYDTVHSLLVYMMVARGVPHLSMLALPKESGLSNSGGGEVRAFLRLPNPSERLEDAINEYGRVAEADVSGMDDSFRFHAKAATGERGRGAVASMFRWACSVLLYATAPGADVGEVQVPAELRKLREAARRHPKGSHKRQRALDGLKKIEQGSNPARQVIGASIRIPGVEGVTREERLAAIAGGRQYRSAWLTKGHWRRQPHGIGWRYPNGDVATEPGRHAVWIKPVVKRRDLGGVLKRTYEVDG